MLAIHQDAQVHNKSKFTQWGLGDSLGHRFLLKIEYAKWIKFENSDVYLRELQITSRSQVWFQVLIGKAEF